VDGWMDGWMDGWTPNCIEMFFFDRHHHQKKKSLFPSFSFFLMMAPSLILLGVFFSFDHQKNRANGWACVSSLFH